MQNKTSPSSQKALYDELTRDERARKSRRRRNWLIGLSLFFAVGIALAVVAVWLVIAFYSRDLPDHKQLAKYNPSVTTRLYAGDGRLMEEYARENRIFVPITAMPKIVIDAFTSAEDQNFYKHSGIDLFGIVRAMGQNLYNYVRTYRKRLIGASTITQQVAKNMLLTNEKTFARKIKEAILAYRMTLTFSKDRIMELYLNDIFLGSGSYGVAAAALNYFNKSVEELTVQEAALLAALPKAPSTYDPRRNYEAAYGRRNWVIDRMREDGHITTTQARRAKRAPIVLRGRDRTEVVTAPFFAEEVRRQIAKEYGEKSLYEGGLTVMTTLDPKLQEIAERAIKVGLSAYDRRQGFYQVITRIPVGDDWLDELKTIGKPIGMDYATLAVTLGSNATGYLIGLDDGRDGVIPFATMKWAEKLPGSGGKKRKVDDVLKVGDVVTVTQSKESSDYYELQQQPQVEGAIVAMDPHNGRVLAMVGGYDHKKSQFNRATQAIRQPGSAFKPFVYGAALENNYTPASLINDEPVEFLIQKKSDINVEEGDGNGAASEDEVWSPQNISGDFYGPTTLRVGLEKSRNVMTVRLAMAIGITKVMEVAKRFGINQNPQRNLATALGATETTLLDLTNAYAILVNGGKRVTPSLIERVQDRNGITVYRRDDRVCQNCQFVGVDQMQDLKLPNLDDTREQVTDPYTAYQVVSMMEGVVKRGTATRALEIGKPIAGKTGTTNNSMDTWFIGMTPDLVVGVFVGHDKPYPLGEKETAATVALPMFVDFMKEALADKPATPFRIPPGIKLVRIDGKTGFLPGPDTQKKDILMEAFKPGTEPKIAIKRSEATSAIVEKKPSGDQEKVQEQIDERRLRDMPATRGTGGIY